MDKRRETKDERRKTKNERRHALCVSVSRLPPDVFCYKSGQSMIEFTFAMLATLVLLYGLLMVFRWAGLDLAERRFAHEHLLTNAELRPEQQLNPDFFKPRKIDGNFRGFDLK